MRSVKPQPIWKAAAARLAAAVTLSVVLVALHPLLAQSAAGSATESAGTRLTGAVTDPTLYLPYLAVAACCAVVVGYATRPQRGTQ